eukprot:565430-Alexandrium_andersonii.AAC.1
MGDEVLTGSAALAAIAAHYEAHFRACQRLARPEAYGDEFALELRQLRDLLESQHAEGSAAGED